MVRHIILWDYADGLTEEGKREAGKKMKEELEGLIHHIDGLISIKVNLEPLASSSAELMLDSTLESEEALAAYQVHPEHVRVANTYVRPATKNRKCMDYLED